MVIAKVPEKIIDSAGPKMCTIFITVGRKTSSWKAADAAERAVARHDKGGGGGRSSAT